MKDSRCFIIFTCRNMPVGWKRLLYINSLPVDVPLSFILGISNHLVHTGREIYPFGPDDYEEERIYYSSSKLCTQDIHRDFGVSITQYLSSLKSCVKADILHQTGKGRYLINPKLIKKVEKFYKAEV